MAAYYTFEDLSGGKPDGPKSDNPYQDLIDSCDNDPAKIQARYNTHRTNRNAQQHEKLLSPDSPGVTVDEILAKLHYTDIEPGFKDPRYCLVFWARPPQKTRDLIGEVQRRLVEVLPNLWTMPSQNLHMTALEITHSRTEAEIDALAAQLLPHAQTITNFTQTHRARVVKPTLSFDGQAFALSFLPAADENAENDTYTYHHLRRDLFTQATAAGVKVDSRYVIPSAHLTIGRYVTTKDTVTADGKVDGAKMAELMQVAQEINEWLEKEFWTPGEGGKIKDGGEWIVGEEKGLDFRKGALWYGGGQTILLGKGF